MIHSSAAASLGAVLAVRLAALGNESVTTLALVYRFITYISVIIVGAAVFATTPLLRYPRLSHITADGA